MATRSTDDPNEIIRKVTEAGMGVRFGRGVVAKTGYVMGGLLAIWLAVVWKLSASLILNCFLVGAALIASALVLWWIRGTQKFAERNPAQAMLDGAEFLEYRKFEAQVKGDLNLAGGNVPQIIEARDRTRG
jgi:hypothetical protein